MEFVRKFEKSKNLETLTLVIFKEGKKLKLIILFPEATSIFEFKKTLPTYERMKNKFSNIAYRIRCSVGDDLKIIISTKSNAVESNHTDESDIRIYITFHLPASKVVT